MNANLQDYMIPTNVSLFYGPHEECCYLIMFAFKVLAEFAEFAFSVADFGASSIS